MVPTCVGVNRGIFARRGKEKSGPHVCGGEPMMDKLERKAKEWSPRVWG